MAIRLATMDVVFQTKGYEGVRKQLERMERQGKQTARGVATTTNAFRDLKRLIVAGGVIAGLKMMVSQLLSVNRETERLYAQLETVQGSADAATAAFRRMEKFAAETPFSIGQITQAFILLRALGVDPTNEELTGLGNLASSFGSTILDVAEAVRSAAAGMTMPIKRLGIDASVAGNQITLSFQGAKVTVGKNAADIVKALRGISDEHFGGAMAREMGTLNGILSNTQDNLDTIMRQLGRGFMPILRDFTNELMNQAGALSEQTASLEKWGKIAGTLVAGLYQTVSGVVRLVVNSFDIVQNVILGIVAEFITAVGQMVNAPLDLINKLLEKINYPLRLATIPLEGAQRASAKAADGIVKNANDIRDAWKNALDAWMAFAHATGAAGIVAPQGTPGTPGAGGGRGAGGAAGPQGVAGITAPLGLRNMVPQLMPEMPEPDELFAPWVAALQEAIQNASDTIERNIEQTIGDAIYNGFAAAFSGEGLAGIFAAFGKTVLAGMGALFVDLGKQLIAYGIIMAKLMPFLLNIFTSGPAAIAAGAALIALGSAFTSVASGIGRGTATAGSFREPQVGPVQDIATRQVTFGASTPVGGGGTMSVNNWTVIGPNDPKAQRTIQEIVRKANARGIR